ncbi:MAG: glycosidase [Lachnospiraceae bacterium]|nr:glycosidase [Lachnospiraceae bacterium]
MLNAYPDSMGGTLNDIVGFLSSDDLKDTFSSFYILPSLYHTDLDRGFSVIDYSLEESLAKREDLSALQDMGIDLKLDFILNHASVQSPQFKDLVAKGEASTYKDFFINWNEFWAGKGEMTPEGYIKPDDKYIKDMFFRKPGLPILMVKMPDGKKVPYWNTFYQEVKETPEGEKYLGQMDLNIKSPLVWDFYDDTLKKISEYGASIVRLDAFAYAPKEPGLKNFLNEPGTWDLLSKVRALADKYGLTLLPEIHASYSEKIYETIADKGYMTYDFFLPGLIIDAFENKDGSTLVTWANELIDKKIRTVNMLGCHDGIPLLDLKGLIPEEQIEKLIKTVVGRGGFVKDLHGAKNMYYQVNATYYSALGEDDKKMLAARALQLFMPGKPQVWYLDLLAGKNDYEAVKAAGAGGHKEINRTNYTSEMVSEALKKDVVKRQIELLRFRNSFGAFSFDSTIEAKANKDVIFIKWIKGEYAATLKLNLTDFDCVIIAKDKDGERVI